MTSPSFNYDAWKQAQPQEPEEHNGLCVCPACDPDTAREVLREMDDWEPEG